MTNNLPELTGSPKQIAWAEDIRDRLASYNQNTTSRSFQNVMKITSAKFWIETRNCNWIELGGIAGLMEDGYSLFSACRRMRIS